MKYCYKCDTHHELSEFGKDRNKPDGLKLACKKSRNEENRIRRNANPENHRKTNLAYARSEHGKFLQWANSLRRKFWPTLTAENAVTEYYKLLTQQNDCCGLCKKHKSNFKTRLHVDHCHTTLVVRGLLCNKCNRFEVGRHSLATAKALVEYLTQTETPQTPPCNGRPRMGYCPNCICGKKEHMEDNK